MKKNKSEIMAVFGTLGAYISRNIDLNKKSVTDFLRSRRDVYIGV